MGSTVRLAVDFKSRIVPIGDYREFKLGDVHVGSYYWTDTDQETGIDIWVVRIEKNFEQYTGQKFFKTSSEANAKAILADIVRRFFDEVAEIKIVGGDELSALKMLADDTEKELQTEMTGAANE